MIVSDCATFPVLSPLDDPTRRPNSKPSLSIRIDVGRPTTANAAMTRILSAKYIPRFWMPISSSNYCTGRSPPWSIESGRTWKSAPPRRACNASSVGISSRQGTHQVAQMFKSTTRPWKSSSYKFCPWSSTKGRESIGRGSSWSEISGCAKAGRAASAAPPVRKCRRFIVRPPVAVCGPWAECLLPAFVG